MGINGGYFPAICRVCLCTAVIGAIIWCGDFDHAKALSGAQKKGVLMCFKCFHFFFTVVIK